VEVTYATPAPGAIGFGRQLDVSGPSLETPEVEVAKTFWTVYTPDGFDCSGFGGNAEAVAAQEADAVLLEANVKEYAGLADIAQRATGQQKAVANYNLARQQERINRQIEVCQGNLGKGSGQAKSLQIAQQVFTDNNEDYGRLNDQISRQRREDEKKEEERRKNALTFAGDEVNVGGNFFARTESGWTTNKQVFKKGNRVQWANVGQNDAAPQKGGKDVAQEQTYTLNIPQGQELNLSNAQVDAETQATQRRRGAGRGYYAQRQQKQQKVEEFARQQQKLQIDQLQQAGGVYGIGGGGGGDLAPTTGRRAPASGEETGGLLSIQVAFATPGTPMHFASDEQGAPTLTFKTYPDDADDSARSAAQALVLLLLFVGVFRLGLLGPATGIAAARQTLGLIVALAFAGLVFANTAGAVVALLVSLWAIRHGRLGASATPEVSA
jgi:hypothetical protein